MNFLVVIQFLQDGKKLWDDFMKTWKCKGRVNGILSENIS